MPPTRLLVLGVVRILQPVHGYFVRRELLSWRADQWANVNPGSIYNALRTLARDGYLAEVETSAEAGRPAKTSYRLTPDGEIEFQNLLHEAFWTVDEYTTEALYAAIGFMGFLPRDYVRAALEHRTAHIEATKLALEFKEKVILRDPNTPPYVVETLRLADARLAGELEWSRALLERIRAGEYVFESEGPQHRRADSTDGATPEPEPAPPRGPRSARVKQRRT
jgi:DNA-binding PadR family transcriptional regulator